MRDVIHLENLESLQSLIRERPSAPAKAAPARCLRASPSPLPFPRPSPLFVGRQEDLGRCQRLLLQAPLLFTYGLPGLGKTEFIYRLVDALRATPRWRRAQPLLLRAQAGQRVEDWLARLGSLLRIPRALRQPAAPAGGDAPDDLVALARCLDDSAHLVFLDDVHHLDPAAVATVLSYLARRIAASRLLIGSRTELPLPGDAPPPAIVRLTPLSGAESATLAARLAECQGQSAPDPEALLARSCGSPRRIHRLLQQTPSSPDPDEEALALIVRQLRPAARELLLLARVLAGKLPPSGWPRPAPGAPPQPEELGVLVRHHLIDPTQAKVPELVWNAITSEVSAAELRRAHHRAAALQLQQCADAPIAAAAGAALSAVEHQLAAQEPREAWQTFQLFAPAFGAEQLGSAALALIPKLRAELPEQRAAIDLLAARLHLSQGQLEQAQELVRPLQSAADPDTAALSTLLAGQVALRAGQLARAEELFRAAALPSASAGSRLQALVQRAELAALRGQMAEARTILDALHDAPFAAAGGQAVPLPQQELQRAAGARAWTGLLLGYPAVAAQAVAAVATTPGWMSAPPLPAPRPPEDPEARLLVLTALAHSGCGELAAARRTLEQVRILAAATGAPAAPAVALCTGVVLLAAGQPAAARAPLQHAYGMFLAQQDLVPAAGAAIALGECSLELGELAPALEQLSDAGRTATRAGCVPLKGLASALRAGALLASGQTETALALAAAVLAGGTATPRARAISRSVRWRVYALAGDTTRAAGELAVAGAEAAESEQEILCRRHALEQAEFHAAYGQPSAAIEYADGIREFFTARGMQHEATRAHLALALALASRRESADCSRAQEFLTEASELATRRGYAPLLLHAALIESALAKEYGDPSAVRAPLARALAAYPAAAHGLSAQPLRAALAGLDAGDWSGNAALLARLGLLPDPESTGAFAGPIELRSTAGRQLLTPDAARAERARFDLAVDLDRSEIFVQATGRLVCGRPLMCALLAQLVTAGLAGADSERLFREVWKGPEYHPLRHRNTIHVALTRLRQLLRELAPARELIETTATGWRLAPESSLCTLRTARG